MKMHVSMRLVVCAVLATGLAGCASPHTRKPANGESATITAEENVRWMLSNVQLQRRLREDLKSVADDLPESVVQEAAQVRQKVCSDSEYLKAMEAFQAIAYRRVKALNEEKKVYEQWLFGDVGRLSR